MQLLTRIITMYNIWTQNIPHLRKKGKPCVHVISSCFLSSLLWFIALRYLPLCIIIIMYSVFPSLFSSLFFCSLQIRHNCEGRLRGGCWFCHFSCFQLTFSCSSFLSFLCEATCMCLSTFSKKELWGDRHLFYIIDPQIRRIKKGKHKKAYTFPLFYSPSFSYIFAFFQPSFFLPFFLFCSHNQSSRSYIYCGTYVHNSLYKSLFTKNILSFHNWKWGEKRQTKIRTIWPKRIL